MLDPSVQFLQPVPEIGTPRICRGFQYSINLDAVQRQILGDWKAERIAQRKHFPSPSSNAVKKS